MKNYRNHFLANVFVLSFFVLLSRNVLSMECISLSECLERGFNSSRLSSVSQIWADNPPKVLSEEELDNLVSSSTLTNLVKISLKDQRNFTNRHLQTLSNNETFRRLFRLDLSGTSVTSVQPLLESSIIGSIRHLPQISARYGRPSSEILVKANENVIIENLNNNPRFDFSIQYKDPSGRKTAPDVVNSIKWVLKE